MGYKLNNIPYICCNFCRDCPTPKMAMETVQRSPGMVYSAEFQNDMFKNLFNNLFQAETKKGTFISINF